MTLALLKKILLAYSSPHFFSTYSAAARMRGGRFDASWASVPTQNTSRRSRSFLVKRFALQPLPPVMLSALIWIFTPIWVRCST